MNQTSASQTISEAVAHGRSALSEIESKQILHSIGIPAAVPEQAHTAAEAAGAAQRIGFPVALKVLSPQVTHKSEVGGVELNLRSAEEVSRAFERIRQNLAARMPSAPFEGVSVQPMGAPGLELIVGITRDDRFGPLVIAGLGGIFVEVLKDTALRLAPVDRNQARAMLLSLRGAAMLEGARGAAAVDIDAIAELIAKLSEFAALTPRSRRWISIQLSRMRGEPRCLMRASCSLRRRPRPQPIPTKKNASRICAVHSPPKPSQ